MRPYTLREALLYGHGDERTFLCPVHGDSNPSASLNVIKKVWYCLGVSERVLTADLRWVEIGTVKVGDHLVGFDENPVGRRRNWKTAVVEGAVEITKPCYRVTLENGDEIVSSEDHLWLTTRPSSSVYEWRRTDALKTRNGNFVSLCKVVDTWDEQKTWERGYLAGAYDGEGSLVSRTEDRKQKLIFYQKDNEMFRVFKDCMETLGFKTNDYMRREGVWSSVLAYKGEIMRLLGSCRPERLLAKFDPDWLGEMHTISQPKIVSVEFIGEQKVMAVQTSTSTYVAEGYASHNCYTCGARGGLSGDDLLIEPDPEVMKAWIGKKLSPRVTYPEAWLDRWDAGPVHPYWLARVGERAARQFRLGYDPEHNAVTYPFRGDYGQVLGVVRRSLEPDTHQKYKYPAGVDAKSHLFNYTPDHHSVVVLTEGAVDAIALWNVGVNAMAIYGSALSAAQVKLLARIDPDIVYTCYDNDDAGWKAHRETERALRNRLVGRITWPRSWGKDIAELSETRRKSVVEGIASTEMSWVGSRTWMTSQQNFSGTSTRGKLRIVPTAS